MLQDVERWRTIIEPFRIKSVEPVRLTTAEHRQAAPMEMPDEMVA